VDSKTTAVRVHRNLSVHVLIYIVLLSTIHHIKENPKFITVTRHYVTLEKLYDMRNKQLYCKK